MPQYYRPVRSGSSRDYYAMSMRHLGASDRDWRTGSPSEDPQACPPGFSGDNCDSTSFIGSHIWTSDNLYKLADGNYYKKGIAFRVFAPNATRVHILASVPGGIEGEYAMM